MESVVGSDHDHVGVRVVEQIVVPRRDELERERLPSEVKDLRPAVTDAAQRDPLVALQLAEDHSERPLAAAYDADALDGRPCASRPKKPGLWRLGRGAEVGENDPGFPDREPAAELLLDKIDTRQGTELDRAGLDQLEV